MTDHADLEIRILELQDEGYPVEMTLNNEQEFPHGYLDPDFLPWVPGVSPAEDGQRLFAWLFADNRLKTAWAEVRGQHPQRRVRLRIDASAPELHAIPWELLRDPGDGSAPQDLAATVATPFSRYLAGRWQPGSPILQRPIKILVAMANPEDLGKFKLEAIKESEEWALLQEATADLDVELSQLPQPCTLPALEAELKKGCHMLHFIGHGSYGEKEGKAVLYMANQENQVALVSDADFAAMLARQLADTDVQRDDKLRLVFLASCQTATRSPADAFRGFAPALVTAGVPAVLAMQDLVPVDTAREFARTFYRQILQHGRVDLAVNDARSALLTAKLPGAAIPVLFMRLRTGQIFATELARAPGAVPLQSPPPPDTFAGRSAELKRLTKVLLSDGDTAISAAIQGMGGLGKTTLALKLGRDLAPHFPAGVLWVEVRRRAQADKRKDDKEVDLQVQAAGVVDWLALQVGLDLKDEPRLEDRAAIVQNTLTRRGRLLVILDDLWDVDLGRWLLKEVLPPDRALLITSRDLALSRALCHHMEELGTLDEPEALELLTNILGPLDGYESAAKKIVTTLEGHTLALELAARLCDNGADDLPWLRRRLKRKPALDILKLKGRESREISIEACLALSYDSLIPDLKRRFRALGVFAPAPFDLAALAAVWGDEDVDDADDAARKLQRRGLLKRAEAQLPGGLEPSHPVYRQHSLLRAYALALLRRTDEEATPADRHAEHFQQLVGESWQAGELYWSQVEHAWQWTAARPVDASLGFLYTIQDFLKLRGRWQLYGTIAAGILEQLRSSKSRVKDQGVILGILGYISNALGEKQQALDYFQQALSIYRQVGDWAGEEATTLNNIGGVYYDLGKTQQALDYFQQALPIYRQVVDRAGEAGTLNNIGMVYDALGDKQQALGYYQHALCIYRQVGDRAGTEATILSNIGGVYYALGDKQQALDYFQQALPIFRQVGHRAGEAGALNNIGRVYSALGEKQQALGYYQKALPIYRQVRNRWGERVTRFNMASSYAVPGGNSRDTCFQRDWR